MADGGAGEPPADSGKKLEQAGRDGPEPAGEQAGRDGPEPAGEQAGRDGPEPAGEQAGRDGPEPAGEQAGRDGPEPAGEQAGRDGPEPAGEQAGRDGPEPAGEQAGRDGPEPAGEQAGRDGPEPAGEQAGRDGPEPAGEQAGRDGPAADSTPAAQVPAGGRQEITKKSRAERLAARNAAAGKDRPIVVDATNHIAGRLASNVAKLLLKGNRVSIVNCERIMISGTRSNIVGEYRQFLEIASILHPKHGPFHPRRPDTIITRMIRGMLPRKKPSGRAAHRRLRAYVGAPKELGAYKRVRFEKAMITRPAARYTTMASLGDAVGWTR